MEGPLCHRDCHRRPDRGRGGGSGLPFDLGPQGRDGAGRGYVIVTLAWAGMGAFGALPYLLTGTIDSVVPALFRVHLRLHDDGGPRC